MFSANRSGGRSRLPSLESSRQRSASTGVHPRDSYGVRRSSSEERKSGSSSVRRWSGVRNSLNSNEAKGAIKDTRPLTDKAYQKKKVAEIVEFLDEENFKPPVTQAKLMQPSKKDFEMIFQFLVSFWEPSFEVKNLEEDAPRVLKNMGYPFIPSKSAFTYVARTNFSSLLGILVYLMDMAKFALNVDLSNLFTTGDSERPEEHAFLLQYIFKCHNSGNVTDEEQIDVFGKIIRTRDGGDLTKLQQDNAEKKEKFREVQEELEKLKQLVKDSELLDSRIEKYEEYLLEMEKHKEKKEAAISKLSEDLKQKTSQLNELERKLGQMQAIYDAQGFDGKKHLSHYEEQKRELNETLQKKRAVLRELQDECWDLDMKHSKILDKGAEICENFNQMYSQIGDLVKTVSCALQNIKDPEVLNMINNFKVDIPTGPTQFNQRTLSAWNKTHKEALEEIQKRISISNVILKTMISAKSEELTEIEMKKMQLSTKLKCASSVETKKEQDLRNLEKQAVEEVKALESKCDEELKELEELRKENRKMEEHVSKLKADLQEIEKLKISKTEMLEKYLEGQKKFFDQLSFILEANAKETEKTGEEIAAELKKLVEITKL